MEPKAILDITYRLYALANFLRSGEAREWRIKETRSEQRSIAAGSRTSAAHGAEYIKDMNFDPKTFMPIVLGEAEAEGKICH